VSQGEDSLFSADPPCNALIERRLYWLAGWHLQRRGQEVSRRTGLARNTLRAYSDARPLCGQDGRTGRRLTTLMTILSALDVDWIAANLAAAHASSAEEMLRLTRQYALVQIRSARGQAHGP